MQQVLKIGFTNSPSVAKKAPYLILLHNLKLQKFLKSARPKDSETVLGC